MLTDDSLARAIEEEVRLEPHNSGWAAQFVVERDQFFAVLPGRFIAIEHVGSTAVPGLTAKPIIDILGGQ